MLLQKHRSGPLGSQVLVVDVEITSRICKSHDASCSIQKSLHDDDLENGLRGGRCSCHDMQRRNPAKMRCFPSGVGGDLELHDQGSRCGSVLLWCDDPVVGLM